MELKDIISVSGKSGLFKSIAQSKNGLVVESIPDGKRFHAHATSKISALEEISIYTDGDDVPLSEIFDKVFEKEKEGKTLDAKSDKQILEDYLVSILPNYDKSRVYYSDLKKIFGWYNTLHDAKLLIPSKDEEVKDEGSDKNKLSGNQPKTTGKNKAKTSSKKVASKNISHKSVSGKAGNTRSKAPVKK